MEFLEVKYGKGLERKPGFKKWRLQSSHWTTWTYYLSKTQGILALIWTLRLTDVTRISSTEFWIIYIHLLVPLKRWGPPMKLVPMWGISHWLGKWRIGPRPSCEQLWMHSAQDFAGPGRWKLRGSTGSKEDKKERLTKIALIDRRHQLWRIRAFRLGTCAVSQESWASHCASDCNAYAGRLEKRIFGVVDSKQFENDLRLLLGLGNGLFELWVEGSTTGKESR